MQSFFINPLIITSFAVLYCALMDKKAFRAFEISIFNLSSKVHEYRFPINETLFGLFEQSIVERGEGTCEVVLTRSETMMTLHFNLNAKVELICDISVKPFWQDIVVEKDIMVKFGDEDEELSEDVIVIHWDTQFLNVAEYIYQFLLLSIPMKKIHPDIEDEERPDIVYISDESEQEEEQLTDPRWAALKNLKQD